MIKRPISFAVLALLLLALAFPAQAQWKWRDAGGKIQYSDLPPPNGTPDKDILQRPVGVKPLVVIQPFGATVAASAPAPAPSGPSKAELEREAKQKKQDQDAMAKQKEEERKLALQRRENCGRAQANMKMLQDGVRLTRANEKGESVPLDERQRAEEIQRTRNVMTSECR